MGTRAACAELLAAEDQEATLDSEDWSWHQTAWTAVVHLSTDKILCVKSVFRVVSPISLQRIFWSEKRKDKLQSGAKKIESQNTKVRDCAPCFGYSRRQLVHVS